MGFFSDLSRKATETCKTTGEKTNKIAKEMKLKSYIGECKNKIDGIYTEIGKKVYEKHILGENINIEVDLKDEIERIDVVAQRIEAMNNEIRTLNNLKVCTNCDSEIDLNARFCPKCGTKLEIPEEKASETVEENNANAEEKTSEIAEENNANAEEKEKETAEENNTNAEEKESEIIVEIQNVEDNEPISHEVECEENTQNTENVENTTEGEEQSNN